MAILKQGSTTLNVGAKGDKGDMPSFTINSTPVVDGSEVVIEGGAGLSNTFEATAVTLVDVANATKIAMVGADINLGGATITLQDGMLLQFNGGKFINGTVTGTDNSIQAHPYEIFASDVTVDGTWVLDKVYPEFETDLKKTAVWAMLKL